MGNLKGMIKKSLVFSAVFTLCFAFNFTAKTVHAGDSDVTLTFELEDKEAEYKTGDIIPFKIIVENYGPDFAENVKVEFVIPEGCEYISSEFSDNSGSHTYSHLTNTYVWHVNGMDLEHQAAWIKVSVLDPGSYIMKAVLTTDNDDYNLSNNTGRIYLSAKGRSIDTAVQNNSQTKRLSSTFFSGQTVYYTQDGEGFVELELTREKFLPILKNSQTRKDENIVIKPGIYGMTGFMLDLDLETLDYYKFYEYFEINAVNFTLALPQGLMSELYKKYTDNVCVSVRKSGNEYVIKFYHKGIEIDVNDANNPILFGIKHDGSFQRNEAIVMYSLENGKKSYISRSWYSESSRYVWAKIYSNGSYGCEYKGLKGFTDTATKWMDSSVQYLYARAIITSDETMLFNPDSEITRLEYVVMVLKALGLENEKSSGLKRFEDMGNVAEEYREMINFAADLGLVSGDGYGYFRPHNTVTRQEMFMIAYRAFNKYSIIKETDWTNASAGFTDWAKVDANAKKPIIYMLELGLISKEANTLNPQSAATKAQAAAFINNILHYDGDR